MKPELKKLMARPWKYDISRNVQFWHDELSVTYFSEGFADLKLPGYDQVRIHRGIHADFYYDNEGKNSKNKLWRALWENFRNKKYIDFLEEKYKAKGNKLIQYSKKLKADYHSLASYFRQYGLLTPMLDTTATASKVVTEYLLKSFAGRDNMPEIIAYFSRPTKRTPIRKLEREIEINYGKKTNQLALAKRLHKKYCWIPISFMGEPWNLQYFINKIGKYEPENKRILEKLSASVSKEQLYYLRLLGRIAYLNEYRKAFFTQSNYFFRPLMDKIARGYKLGSWRDLSMLTTKEILDLFLGKAGYQKQVIKLRKKPWMIYSKANSQVGYLHSQDVLEFEKKFQIKKTSSSLLRGVIANRGRVTGRVKIIHQPKEFSKFKQGDILVATMTSVDFIPIMKKAGAFVTDEGGLACHAAIVSRELDVPCIIDTKIATKVFKDGDMVEVDAKKGVVKKI